MIAIIFGAPGAGKSSLNTHFLIETYRTRRRQMIHRSQELVARANDGRIHPLELTDEPPIFANYRVRFKTGYEKWFEPFYINPYYMGLPNEKMRTQFLPPDASVHISEGQRYYNSRKSKTFPDWVSRFFEMHRHYQMNIYIDVQRPSLIDVNIRELCRTFIEVRNMEHFYDDAGRITASVFHCRTFEKWGDVEQYMTSGGQGFVEKTYRHEGNIFRAFDSHSYFLEFLPPEGQGFKFLPFGAASGQGGVDAVFYTAGEPKEYRG